jgi:hypothetical protein
MVAGKSRVGNGFFVILIVVVQSVTKLFAMAAKQRNNRIAHIRHQFRKAIALSCHRCLINTGVKKMIYI